MNTRTVKIAVNVLSGSFVLAIIDGVFSLNFPEGVYSLIGSVALVCTIVLLVQVYKK